MVRLEKIASVTWRRAKLGIPSFNDNRTVAAQRNGKPGR